MRPDKVILSTLAWLEKHGLKLFYVVLVLLVAGDYLVPKEEPMFPGHDVMGFWALWGFGCAMIITGVWKTLSKLFLHKGDDYYD